MSGGFVRVPTIVLMVEARTGCRPSSRKTSISSFVSSAIFSAKGAVSRSGPAAIRAASSRLRFPARYVAATSPMPSPSSRSETIPHDFQRAAKPSWRANATGRAAGGVGEPGGGPLARELSRRRPAEIATQDGVALLDRGAEGRLVPEQSFRTPLASLPSPENTKASRGRRPGSLLPCTLLTCGSPRRNESRASMISSWLAATIARRWSWWPRRVPAV